MICKISIRTLFIVGGLLGLVLLYTANFFVCEERIFVDQSVYIEGATHSTIIKWEMY